MSKVIYKIILILFLILIILMLLEVIGSDLFPIKDVVQNVSCQSLGQNDGGAHSRVVCSHTGQDDCSGDDEQLLSLGDFLFFHRGSLMVLFDKVVFTFIKTKELHKVFLGDWFW